MLEFVDSGLYFVQDENSSINPLLQAGMRIRIRIRSDPVIFGPPDPDPVLFSTDPDPDPDPTCNNGFIKLFLS